MGKPAPSNCSIKDLVETAVADALIMTYDNQLKGKTLDDVIKNNIPSIEFTPNEYFTFLITFLQTAQNGMNELQAYCDLLKQSLLTERLK